MLSSRLCPNWIALETSVALRKRLSTKSRASFLATKTIMDVRDSNGNLLNEGDSVTVIKDLKVKGSSSTIKRGTVVKNIRLTDDEAEIEGRVERTVMVLKTAFLKKV
jgi:protein PhnA